MAKLSRHRVDRTFYIRTGNGYYGTKQVHLRAVRYLNQRNVFLGDEIPPGLMQKMANTKGWLFTKTENPEVFFFEFNDPKFGVRPVPKSAVQGTTKVVSVGEFSPPMNGNIVHKKRKSKTPHKVHSSVSGSVASKRPVQSPPIQTQPKHKQSPIQPVIQAMPTLAETRQELRSDSMLNAFDASPNDSLTKLDHQSDESDTWFDRTKNWYVSGGDLPLWMLILFVVLLLVASLMLSRAF